VETGETLPFDVSLHSVNYVPSHWHNSIEIIFVLLGTLEVTIGNERRTLFEGDVFLINSWHVHEVIGRDLSIIGDIADPRWRFFLGADLFPWSTRLQSKQGPVPLNDLEKLFILAADGGVTGWHHSITRPERYKPHFLISRFGVRCRLPYD